jgi:hypothetical protein
MIARLLPHGLDPRACRRLLAIAAVIDVGLIILVLFSDHL